MINWYASALEELESGLDQTAQTIADLLWELEYDEIEAILETDLTPLSSGNSLIAERVQMYLFGLLREGKMDEMRRIAQEIDEYREAHEDEDEDEEAADEAEQNEAE